MNRTTEYLTAQMKKTLLALPDVLLTDTVLGWIERADAMHQHLGCSDKFRGVFGYQLQSGETEEIYDSFTALDRSESEATPALWIPPTAEALRGLLSHFSLPDFHDLVIPLADDAISATDPYKDPCWPSTGLEDGQPFMRCLIPYLQQIVDQEPENSYLILPRRVARTRNNISTSYKDSPCYCNDIMTCNPIHNFDVYPLYAVFQERIALWPRKEIAFMTQQDDVKKQDQTSTENDKIAKKTGQSASQQEIKKHPGTKTMEHVAKADKDDNIANPNAARGSSSDGDSAG